MTSDTQHKTYLLTWNPSKWAWAEFTEDSEAVAMGYRPVIRWSCGNTKRITQGDRVFLMCLGKDCPNHGIMASGTVLVGSYEAGNWDKAALRVTSQYVDFEPEVLLDPGEAKLWDPGEEKLWDTGMDLRMFNWHPQSSGVEIPSVVALELERQWQERVGVPESSELEGASTYIEGSRFVITSHRYERDPAARQACIDFYGFVCQVCGLDLEIRYGDIGKGFIHVHHLTPISEIGQQYRIDPVNDMRPVCPNCHAMLHRRSPPYTIDELKAHLRE